MAKARDLRSEIAWSTPTRIVIKGHDLCAELLGRVSLGDMMFLELTDRLPTASESLVFNAIAVTLVEHGMTPSAIVARMTLSGAPGALQAAVAAGLCGLGEVFVGSMEDAACMLQEGISAAPETEPDALAEKLVHAHLAGGKTVPGIGHHFHKPVDPRSETLFSLAAENGLSGRHVALMLAVSRAAERAAGKSLPVNATGAIAAIASELGIHWSIIRGIGVAARAIGLLGHIREEMRQPMAREIKRRVDEEASAFAKAAAPVRE